MNTKDIREILDICTSAPLLQFKRYNERTVFVVESLGMQEGKPILKGRVLEAIAGCHGRMELNDSKWFWNNDASEAPHIREYEMTFAPREFIQELCVVTKDGELAYQTEEQWREKILTRLNIEHEETRPNTITTDDINALLIATGRNTLSGKSAQSMTPAVRQLLMELLQTSGEPCHA